MKDEIEKTAETSFWCDQIDIYERTFKKWESRAKGINDRYKDEREKKKSVARFNILWSNVQTLAPAIYDSPPKPNIERRRKDYDNSSRSVSQVLEKSVSYFADDLKFDDVMRQVVLDRLLAGRGTAWVRYVPSIEGDELYGEDVVLDYVNWSDFGHTPARIWNDVRAVWRKVYMSRKELKARFLKRNPKITEEILVALPMEAKLTDDEKVPSDKIAVYEIWDKVTKKAYWVNKNCPDLLDSQDDPLRLMEFFPCPRPLYSSNSTDNLVPLPDYFMYQDQAVEVDDLTERIQALTKALKIVGVYDKTAEGVQRILETGVENTLIPVANWAVFGEKGGLKGVVDYFPVQDVMAVLASLFQAREAAKQALYEISGISDIVRGATKASETATAQKIKGQFATLRIDAMQASAARFARDIIAIMTEIIAEHFSMDTIKRISGVPLLTQVEKQQIAMSQQPPLPQGMPPEMMAQIPPPPPLPFNVQRMLKDPTWEEIEQIIRDDMARCFAISVETDSTIKIDQENDKKMRSEFLSGVSNFLQQAVQVQDPTMKPLLMEMLLFGTKGFKIGRDLETAFMTMIDSAKMEAEKPKEPPPPDPSIEITKMQLDSQNQKMQGDMKIKDAELGIKDKEASEKINIEREKIELDRQELLLKERELNLKEEEMRTNARIEREKMVASADKDNLLMDENGNISQKPQVDIAAVVEQVTSALQDGLANIAESQAQSNMAIAQSFQNPPPRKVIYDTQGNVAGVE